MVWHQNGALNQKWFICAPGSASPWVFSDNLLGRTGQDHQTLHHTQTDCQHGTDSLPTVFPLNPNYNDGLRCISPGPSANQHKQEKSAIQNRCRGSVKMHLGTTTDQYHFIIKLTNAWKGAESLNKIPLLLSRFWSLLYNKEPILGCPVSASNIRGKH